MVCDLPVPGPLKAAGDPTVLIANQVDLAFSCGPS